LVQQQLEQQLNAASVFLDGKRYKEVPSEQSPYRGLGTGGGTTLLMACWWPDVKGIFPCTDPGLAGLEDWVQRETSWLHALAVSSMVAHAVHPSCDVPDTAPLFQLCPHEFARLLHTLESPCSIVLNGWAYVMYDV